LIAFSFSSKHFFWSVSYLFFFSFRHPFSIFINNHPSGSA
jgi:hypothetical protein